VLCGANCCEVKRLLIQDWWFSIFWKTYVLSFHLSIWFLDELFSRGFGRVLSCMGGCCPSKLPIWGLIQYCWCLSYRVWWCLSYRIIDCFIKPLSFHLSNWFFGLFFRDGFGRVLSCMGGCHLSKLLIWGLQGLLIVFIQDCCWFYHSLFSEKHKFFRKLFATKLMFCSELSFHLSNWFLDELFSRGFGRVLYEVDHSALDHPASSTPGYPPTMPPFKPLWKKPDPPLNLYTWANEKWVT